jgi:hypothetical protein
MTPIHMEKIESAMNIVLQFSEVFNHPWNPPHLTGGSHE